MTEFTMEQAAHVIALNVEKINKLAQETKNLANEHGLEFELQLGDTTDAPLQFDENWDSSDCGYDDPPHWDSSDCEY